MNIAVLIGVSEYSAPLGPLPACARDVSLVRTVLEGARKYDHILTIDSNTGSVALKDRLIGFINGLKGAPVEEAFFFYSGHGDFTGGDFFYLLTDYSPARRNQTALQNSELDNLLRALQPSLTVKVVDACHSGITYVKDDQAVDSYLKGTQASFKRCYFMFSSLASQASYQDSDLSYFTRAFLKGIAEHPAPSLRYKDVIDHVSDSFAGQTGQIPFFVTQADFTEPFLSITPEMRSALATALGVAQIATSVSAGEPEDPLLKVIQADSHRYCSEGEAVAAVKHLSDLLAASPVPPEAAPLYSVKHETREDLLGVPGLESIGKWLLRSKNGYFADVETSEDESRISTLAPAWLSQSLLVQTPHTHTRVERVESSVRLPTSQIRLVAERQFPNLPAPLCIVVPFVSRTSLCVFVANARYRETGWTTTTIK